MEKGLVSIIIPVYNVEKYLNDCLNSILLQTYKNYEVIIINDGSTDNSLNIANQYCHVNNKFKVYTKENSGLGDSRNFGLKYAKGEYVLFIDSDDSINLNYIEDCYNAAKQNDADIVFASLYFDFLQKPSKNYLIEPVTKFDKLPIELINLNSPTIPTKFIKHQFIKINQLKFYNYRYEDITFTTQMLLKNPKVNQASTAIYNYVQRSNSIMQTNDNRIKEIEIALANILESFDRKNQVINSQIEFLIVRNLLLASLNRISKIKDYKKAKEIMKSHWIFLQKMNIFWPKKVIIIRENLSLINYYILKLQTNSKISILLLRSIRLIRKISRR